VFIEGPTNIFLKKPFKLQTEANLRVASSIKNLELSKETPLHN
ncbi:15917_t:CDS:1, partial [Dentiscutata heterogama]